MKVKKAAFVGATVLALGLLAAVQTRPPNDLEVGDCIDEPSREEFDTVPTIDCAESHDGELFYIFELEGSTYPSREGIQDAVIEQCIPAYETFVGSEYATSELEIGWFEPTSNAWTTGDRSVQCYVFDPAGKLTESVRGSGL